MSPYLAIMIYRGGRLLIRDFGSGIEKEMMWKSIFYKPLKRYNNNALLVAFTFIKSDGDWCYIANEEDPNFKPCIKTQGPRDIILIFLDQTRES